MNDQKRIATKATDPKIEQAHHSDQDVLV